PGGEALVLVWGVMGARGGVFVWGGLWAGWAPCLRGWVVVVGRGGPGGGDPRKAPPGYRARQSRRPPANAVPGPAHPRGAPDRRWLLPGPGGLGPDLRAQPGRRHGPGGRPPPSRGGAPARGPRAGPPPARPPAPPRLPA